MHLFGKKGNPFMAKSRGFSRFLFASFFSDFHQENHPFLCFFFHFLPFPPFSFTCF